MFNVLKKIILGSFVLTVCTVSAPAMDMPWGEKTMVSGGFKYISPGISWNNIDNINNALATQGISPFSGMALTLSAGINRQWGHLVTEKSITWRFWSDNVDGNTRTSLWAGDIGFNTGFNLFPTGAPLTLVPYVGIGGGLNALHIRNDKKNLADLIVSTQPNAMMWQGTFLFNLGIGTDLLLSKDMMEHGLALGLRIGYLFDPFTRNMRWYSDGVYVNDIAAMNQGGGYIRLVLGAWKNPVMQEKE